MLSQKTVQRLKPSAVDWLCAAAGRGGAPSETPPHIDPQHVRMFVLSHLFGPIIGLSLAAFLAALGFPIDHYMLGFVALVCLFWLYPAALAKGANYRLLSIASLQHLTLTTLWASYAYGGLTSPFLLWLAVVPLLAFLYCAPDRRLWLILITMLAGNLALYAGITLIMSPPRASDPELRWLAAVSLFAAFAYVSMMAVYFGRVLDSRDEMALQAERHLATAVALDKTAKELRTVGANKASSLARIARECRAPLDEILSSSRTMLEVETRDASGAEVPDLQSVDEAARHLSAVMNSIDQYARSRLAKL